MDKKFFREKNAFKIKDAIIQSPTESELILLVKEKLNEKIEQIRVINNKKMREKYLKNKNKYELSLTMSELEVKKLLTERVCIDIFELINTLSALENSPLKPSLALDTTTDVLIAKQMKIALNSAKKDYLDTIFALLLALCNNYNFKLTKIETKQKEVEHNEGSFLKGKIVYLNK